MKVAIYGDSFAQNFWDSRYSPGESWVDILSDRYEIRNFSVSGSSVWFSYTTFINNQSKFDRNIFLISNDERIYFHRLETKVSIIDHAHFQVHQLLDIKDLYNSRFSDNKYKNEILDIWTAATNFRRMVDTSDEDKLKNFLLLEHMKNKYAASSIFINCFDGNEYFMQDSNFMSLVDIRNLENRAWNLYDDVDILDIRHCHMTNDNNAIFAEKLDTWIRTNNFDMAINDFIVPKMEEKEIYIKHAGNR